MPAFDSSIGGLASTSYVSIVDAADALSLLVSLEELATWNALDLPVRESLLMRATHTIDRSFKWQGFRNASDQRLCWPRARAYVDGQYVPTDSIPRLLVDAVCLFAGYLNVGFSYESAISTPLKAVKIGPINVVFDDSKNVASPSSLPSEIIEMLQWLGDFTGLQPGVKVVELTRA